ncbi:MAG: hypothetical protein DI566_13455 [Microbacterium sp.]|nr:MAG: hypothetical protein DI566_13455 [Microbacterium sp.]
MKIQWLAWVFLIGVVALLLASIGVDAAHSQDVDARIVRESTAIEQARPWIVTIVTFLSFCFSLYLYLNQAKKSELKEITALSEQKIDELRFRFDGFSQAVTTREVGHAEKLQTVSERLLSVEEKLKNAPTDDEIHALRLTVAEVQGDVKVVVNDIRAMARSHEKIERMLTEDRRRS